jgi:hypothetical protein
MTDKKKSERSIDTGGGDYVEGNQTKVTMGNVSGSTIVVGHGNTVTGANQPGASLPELIKLVAEIRGTVAQAKLDADSQDAVDGQFRAAEEQLKKPEPKKIQVLPLLKAGAEALTLAAAAGEVATTLPPLIEKAITWAQMVLK